MKSVISVDLPQQAYDITVASGGLAHLGQWMQPLKLGQKVLVVSSPPIWKHYGQAAIDSLTQAGFTVESCSLPPGERYKTLASIQKIYDAALGMRLERSSTIVAIGGGVIGDMSGFAAATWLRGIHFSTLR